MTKFTIILVFYGSLLLPSFLSTANAEDWKVLSDEVCFHALGKKPGEFTLQYEGFLQAVRLTHLSGGVNCYKKQKDLVSKFGCVTRYKNLKGKVSVSVTDGGNRVVFPLEMKGNGHSHIYAGGNWANASVVTFFDDFRPAYLETGAKLKVWYGEDLRFSEDHAHSKDNEGKSCCKVEGLLLTA